MFNPLGRPMGMPMNNGGIMPPQASGFGMSDPGFNGPVRDSAHMRLAQALMHRRPVPTVPQVRQPPMMSIQPYTPANPAT